MIGPNQVDKGHHEMVCFHSGDPVRMATGIFRVINTAFEAPRLQVTASTTHQGISMGSAG